MSKENKLVIYQASNGAIELKSDYDNETIWATRVQMAEMFEVNPQAISKHIKNIYTEKELDEDPTSSKMELVQNESGRVVKRNVNIYNLDVLISVGYRISSSTGTKFRKWATRTLRQHITQGYTINLTRITKNYDAFILAVNDIQRLASNKSQLQATDVLALIKSFAHTWFSLESYDKDKLPKTGLSKKDIILEANILYEVVAQLKSTLMENKQATQLFAQEKNKDSLAGIVGSVFQTVFGEDAYPTLEEKAAHLLYFIIKDHPFNDGNKRTAAFAFIWFLQQAGLDFRRKITPEALTALTLLIAESKPDSKNRMIGLVILLLTGANIQEGIDEQD